MSDAVIDARRMASYIAGSVLVDGEERTSRLGGSEYAAWLALGKPKLDGVYEASSSLGDEATCIMKWRHRLERIACDAEGAKRAYEITSLKRSCLLLLPVTVALVPLSPYAAIAMWSAAWLAFHRERKKLTWLVKSAE